MLEDAFNRNPRVHIPVEHLSDQVDATLAQHKWYTQIAVHDLVSTVEGILSIDYSVEKDTKRPHILLLAAVGPPSKNFWGSVIYKGWQIFSNLGGCGETLTNSPHENIERTIFDVRRASKIDELYVPLTI